MLPPPHKPGDPASLSDDAESILRAVRGIVRSVTIHSKQLLRECGMTLPQILCLRAIGAASQAAADVTSAQIARDVQLSPATVTGIIDRLQRAELVERERDTSDRRKVYLRLTAKGQEWLTSLPSSLQDRAVERLNGLSPEHRSRILESLNEVLQIMEAEDIETSPMLVPGEQSMKPVMDIRIAEPDPDEV
jgi:DNA-binding MarR family transcriptional regulator